MKILLFGSSGMLGHYIQTILSLSHNVELIAPTRSQLDITQVSDYDLEQFVYRQQNLDAIVNCICVIPQRYNPTLYRDYIKINTLFPQVLSQIARKYQIQLIHITTDCVFSGKKNPDVPSYDETSSHDDDSLYGVSKSLGEPQQACVIRTSIIGEEHTNKQSLLEWVISNQGGKINGYSDHYWNGVTCLTLAEIIKQIITQNLYWTGVRHIFSPDRVTKYQLCQYINEVYQLGIEIIPTTTPLGCDRTLSSIYPPMFMIDDIRTQILKQRIFKT